MVSSPIRKVVPMAPRDVVAKTALEMVSEIQQEDQVDKGEET
jgi:hypothetical protein